MKILDKIIQSGKIPNSLLFVGDEVDKIAEEFATNLIGENPFDLHHYYPEGRNHPIQSLRQLIDDVALAPFRADWKVYIIHEAEKMLPTSANTLLKTFEEPPPQTVIVLLTAHQERILPTILSRCQKYEFPKKKITEFVQDEERPEETLHSLLLWYRDRALLEFGGNEELLHFPDQIEKMRETPYVPLEKVEKLIAQAQLALERSMKPSVCLEMLSIRLNANYLMPGTQKFEN